MKWEYMREEEFEGAIERSGGLCVLPIGCTEKHGQHLPVGCDTIHANGLVELAAEMEEVVVFPATMWLGEVSGYHSLQGDMIKEKRNRGGIGIKQSTILTILEELCDEIARNGFRKILLINSHGGNISLISQFLRNMGYKPRNYSVMSVPANNPKLSKPEYMYPIVMERRDEFHYLTDDDMEALRKFSETGTGGGHADWYETALSLAYYPEYVAPDKYDAENGVSRNRITHLENLGVSGLGFWGANFPDMYHGYAPHGCSENIGKAMAQLICKEHLAKVFKAIKEDEECVKIAQERPYKA